MASYWQEPMCETTARRVLGDAHFDYAVRQGAGYCASRRRGAWDANQPESFAAYDCAGRVAAKATVQ